MNQLNQPGKPRLSAALAPAPTSSCAPWTLAVEVPATAANLGPGFDSLGLALGLANTVAVQVQATPAPVTLQVEGEGVDALRDPANNLLVQAVRQGWQRWAGPSPLPGLHLRCVNRIPLASGLGSSAAAIVAGLAIAWALAAPRKSANGGGGRRGGHWRTVGDLPDRVQQELFELANQLEGHPDNVAAAIWGGLTVALPLSGGGRPKGLDEQDQPDGANLGPWVQQLPLTGPLWAAAVTPAFPLSTARSRQVLPDQVPRQDAVFNLSRTAWLVAAVARQDWARLGAGLQDRLHQPYRASLVPGLMDVLAAGRRAGALGATLSGAGPSVLALALGRSAAQAAGEAMQRVWAQRGIQAKVHTVQVGVSGVKWVWPELEGSARALGEAEGCQSSFRSTGARQ